MLEHHNTQKKNGIGLSQQQRVSLWSIRFTIHSDLTPPHTPHGPVLLQRSKIDRLSLLQYLLPLPRGPSIPAHAWLPSCLCINGPCTKRRQVAHAHILCEDMQLFVREKERHLKVDNENLMEKQRQSNGGIIGVGKTCDTSLIDVCSEKWHELGH